MGDDVLTLRYVPLSQCTLWDRNPKLHDIGSLIASFERHGFKSALKYEPQLNGGKGGIGAGNGRTEALRAMQGRGKNEPRGIVVDANGEWCVPILFGVDAPSQAAAESFGMDDNLLTLSGGNYDLSDMMRLFDNAATDLLQELAVADEMTVAIDSDDLDRLLLQRDGGNQDAEPQIDRAAELQEKWETATGQLWRIAEHRLLIGDSTKREDVERVMQNEHMRLLITDPPYGVSYADKNKYLNVADKGNRVQTPIEGDHLSIDEARALWLAAFKTALDVAEDGCPYYVCSPQGGDLMMMMMMMREAGWLLKPQIIWVKNNHVLGRSDYQLKHEPILYGWKPGTHWFYGDRSQFSVWEIDKPVKSDLHPTMKPIELVERALINSSRKDDIVGDWFVGSGTTIVACQNLGRKCRAIEISPAYCAVTLERMMTAFPDIEIERMNS